MTMTMRRRFWTKEEAPEFIEGKNDYSKRELELIADDILRKDGKLELCRECGEEGRKGDEYRIDPQELKDEEGNQLFVKFYLYSCPNGHNWYEGEGRSKGFKGNNPILFEEHLIQRKRREIYCADGTPDPEIVSGIYNRTHKDGRKVNSAASRKTHGASYYS